MGILFGLNLSVYMNWTNSLALCVLSYFLTTSEMLFLLLDTKYLRPFHKYVDISVGNEN